QELHQFAPGSLQHGAGIVRGEDQAGECPFLPAREIARIHATSPIASDPAVQAFAVHLTGSISSSEGGTDPGRTPAQPQRLAGAFLKSLAVPDLGDPVKTVRGRSRCGRSPGGVWARAASLGTGSSVLPSRACIAAE